MYQPQHFKEERIDVLHQLIYQHPLGTLVTLGNDGLNANHIPFVVDQAHGEFGMLRAHVARANEVWRAFNKDVDALVVFQGPDAYISPSWYPGKKEHGKVVPTWNYAVVHAYGPPVIRDDVAWMREFLEGITDRHASTRATPWKVGDAPEDYLQTMMRAIVGIEIPITKIFGKWKVSQNRPTADREDVAAGLAARDSENEHAMSKLVLGRQER